jgi:hypothetical protein
MIQPMGSSWEHRRWAEMCWVSRYLADALGKPRMGSCIVIVSMAALCVRDGRREAYCNHRQRAREGSICPMRRAVMAAWAEYDAVSTS